jgi:fumarate hydratase subunit alpha
MKVIPAKKITDVVSDLCIKANLELRSDVLSALKSACRRETGSMAKSILKAIIENASIAKKENLAICQDTGLPVVFIELGQNVKIIGDLKRAVNKGVELGYKKASLRNSVVVDPLKRTKPGYQPAVMHFDIVKGNKCRLTVLPKGFGSENKTQVKMFYPTANTEAIKEFVVNTVSAAGADACPPFVVGVGIGGTADYAAFLAKKALLRRLSGRVSSLEQELLKQINKLNIGPMGLGGKTTALAVNIETYPTHIAGLPVAVNISCHALRSASAAI